MMAELDGATPSLRKRIEQVKEAAKENGVDQDVGVDVHYDGSDLTSITIVPNENWTVKGERGLDRFHVILGPRGGVRMSKRSSVMLGDREYHDEKQAWRKTLRAIEGMS